MSTEQRRAVIAAARSWISTPYHHRAMIKGVGIDCATLLQAAYTEAGVVAPFSIKPYSEQWHLHNEEPLYEEAITGAGARLVTEPGAGDVVLYFQGRQFAHGAIITELNPFTIVHAFAPARRVVEGAETEFGVLVGSRKKFFTIW